MSATAVAPVPDGLAEPIARAVRRLGGGCFEDALATPWLAALRREAARRRESARWTELTGYMRFCGGRSMGSPSRYGVGKNGPALDGLHRHPGVVAQLARAAGRELTPTRSAYLFYAPGNFMGLHVDAPACALTMLVAVAGEPPPLTVFPELRGVSHERLAAAARRGGGLAPGGRPLPFPARGFVVLEGHALPHQRGRVPAGGEITVATLCYAPAEP